MCSRSWRSGQASYPDSFGNSCRRAAMDAWPLYLEMSMAIVLSFFAMPACRFVAPSDGLSCPAWISSFVLKQGEVNILHDLAQL